MSSLSGGRRFRARCGPYRPAACRRGRDRSPPADQPPVPAQQRVRRGQAAHPQRPGEEPAPGRRAPHGRPSPASVSGGGAAASSASARVRSRSPAPLTSPAPSWHSSHRRRRIISASARRLMQVLRPTAHGGPRPRRIASSARYETATRYSLPSRRTAGMRATQTEYPLHNVASRRTSVMAAKRAPVCAQRGIGTLQRGHRGGQLLSPKKMLAAGHHHGQLGLGGS
jgi:hypothetical protein